MRFLGIKKYFSTAQVGIQLIYARQHLAAPPYQVILNTKRRFVMGEKGSKKDKEKADKQKKEQLKKKQEQQKAKLPTKKAA